MFKNSFAGRLSKELKKADAWYKVNREKEASREYLIYIFRQGGSLKIPNDPGSDGPDKWEWHGEAGRAVEAVSTFFRDLGDDELRPCMMRGSPHKRSPWYKVKVPDPSVLPIEHAVDNLLKQARTEPAKKRALNEDGALRCIVYSFAKGAVIEVYECRKWRLRGPLEDVYGAVRAADKAYRRHWDALHPRPPQPDGPDHYQSDRARKASAK